MNSVYQALPLIFRAPGNEIGMNDIENILLFTMCSLCTKTALSPSHLLCVIKVSSTTFT